MQLFARGTADHFALFKFSQRNGLYIRSVTIKASVHRRESSSEKFPLIRPDGKWTSGSRVQSWNSCIASYPIAGSIAWSALPRPLYCSVEKENEGKDGAEPRRQSATGNLKSCANTRATGGLDESDGRARKRGRERGQACGRGKGLVGRLVGREAKVYPEKGYADEITYFRAIRSRMIRV